jgi:hypothetical protein
VRLISRTDACDYSPHPEDYAGVGHKQPDYDNGHATQPTPDRGLSRLMLSDRRAVQSRLTTEDKTAKGSNNCTDNDLREIIKCCGVSFLFVSI